MPFRTNHRFSTILKKHLKGTWRWDKLRNTHICLDGERQVYHRIEDGQVFITKNGLIIRDITDLWRAHHASKG